MTLRVSPQDLRAGDVLLYHGTSFLSDLIRLFDGGQYSHASIYDGQQIMEALDPGIVVDPVATSIAGSTYVDVYRFVGIGGAGLGSSAYPPDPVLARIHYYEQNPQRYAYEQILLLAVLASTRRIPVVSWIPGLSLIIRNVLDNAADVVAKLTAMGKEPVICSELTYRCYAEADSGGKYRLSIRGADVLAARAALGFMADPSLLAAGGQPVVDPLAAEKQAFLARFAMAKGRALPAPGVAAAPGGAMAAVADFVTPHDLEVSPNLTKIGTIGPDGGAGPRAMVAMPSMPMSGPGGLAAAISLPALQGPGLFAAAAAGAAGQGSFLDAIALAARGCVLEPYTPVAVNEVSVSGEFVAYASPDSTYAVVREYLQQARQSILIGIYDFNVTYVEDLLLDALGRGVKVSLMLDLAPGDSAAKQIFDGLAHAGARCVLAPSCRNAATAHFFSVAHEKVIVIDNEWCLVQSGNFSAASIPENDADGTDPDPKLGNRDMGVAIHSPELAQLFTTILDADMKKEQTAEAGGAPGGGAMASEAPELPMFAARPTQPPPKLFPSGHFQPAAPIRVLPVLSPDNYMKVIPDFIREAKRSILIEQQYIHAFEVDVNELCQAIRDAMKAAINLDVRIIVAPPFMDTASGRQSVQKDLTSLQNDFQLRLGTNVRLLNHRYFTHLHNKLIIIDNQSVLISSQNWSTQAVTKNREAGLIIRYPELAAYYAQIFELDWSTAVRSLTQAPTPPAMLSVAAQAGAALAAAAGAGTAIPLSPGDYADL